MKTMTRRKFLKGFGPLALAALAAQSLVCGEPWEKRRNKWLKRTGKDRPEPGDGKGGDDDCCKEKK